MHAWRCSRRFPYWVYLASCFAIGAPFSVFWFVPACLCLPMPVHACPCLSMPVSLSAVSCVLRIWPNHACMHLQCNRLQKQIAETQPQHYRFALKWLFLYCWHAPENEKTLQNRIKLAPFALLGIQKAPQNRIRMAPSVLLACARKPKSVTESQ